MSSGVRSDKAAVRATKQAPKKKITGTIRSTQLRWLDQRSTVPLIQALYGQADQWRSAELARARKLLAKGEDVEAVLDALTHRLTQKMLHGAMAELHSADAHSRPQVASALSRLFLRGDTVLPTDLLPPHARRLSDEDLA